MPDQETNTSHLLSPLHKIWTNHSNRTELETWRMYKSHLQSQKTHRPDMGPNRQIIPDGTGRKSPATSEQLINIGIIILQRAGVFTHDIREWLKHPTQEHNWPKSQEHFSKSKVEIKLAQPTAKCMGFHNQIANSAD